MLKKGGIFVINMGEVIITYDTLSELLRREKFRKELQKLEPTFFSDVIKYLGDKEAIIESQQTKTSLFSSETEKTRKQLQNIRKILKELYEKRESKIIELALFSARLNKKEENLSAMMPEEVKIYNQLFDSLSFFRESILNNLINKQLPDVNIEKPKGLKSKKKEEKILVRVKQPIPKFLGPNMQVYGPFEEEDLINLDEGIAQVLLNKNRVEEIKNESSKINEEILQKV